MPSFAQEREVSGTVYNQDQEPLPGVNIVVKGTTQGTTTNASGEYTIQVPGPDAVLVYSFVGMVPREKMVGDKDLINVTLKPSEVGLDEVVVVGYGKVKKSDLTGSVSSVKAEEIENTSLTSIDQGLQGRIPGMVVTQTTGQPGAATTIRIRGTTSLTGRNEPLYVIDGVPVLSDASKNRTGAVKGPAVNPLASINPADIESVEVLKDASATAIYGARGANGVVLITTKQGEKNSDQFSFDAYYGIQQISRKIPMLNARQLAELGNEAADNAGVDRRSIYASPANLGEGTNWQDEIFRMAPIQNYQLSYRGGGNQTTYAMSANFFDQKGIIIGSQFSKASLRVKVNRDLAEGIHIGGNVNYTRSVSDGVITDEEGGTPSSITSWALAMNPALSPYTEEGDYLYENNTNTPATGNPVADALENENKTTTSRLLANAHLQVDILEGLNFKSSFGADLLQNKEQSFIPNFLKRAESNNGQAGVGDTYNYNWVWENTFNFNRDFGDHSFNAVAGQTMQAFKSDFNYTATTDFEDNRLGYHSIQSGAQESMVFSGYRAWQMLSFLGRVNYTYKDRYLLTVSGRVDGSSKFGEGNRYGFFPSFALGWNIHKEPFMSEMDEISNLKLRMSYGVTGNQGIPAYKSHGLLEVTEAYFGESVIAKGTGPQTLANEELRWESTTQYNVGVDLGLWDNRIDVTLDAYLKQTSDLLLNAPTPHYLGYASAFRNVGNLENKGVELSLTAYPISESNYSWMSSFNISRNENLVTNLAGGEEGLVGQPLLGITGWTRVTEGTAVGTFYGYETNGIMQSDEDPSNIPYFAGFQPEPGVRKYVDQNGDGVLNEDDRVKLGNAAPDFSFGWRNNFSYRNWSLNVYLQGVYGNEIVNFNRFGLESLDGRRNNSIKALQRWQPDDPSNKYPKADATPHSKVLSDHQVEDGSFVRVKDITLKYQLPGEVTGRINMESASVYVSAQNAFTLTNYFGYDPEVSRFANDPLSRGADYGSYPHARQFMIGLRTRF